MATATYRRRAGSLAAGPALLAVALAGCGGSASRSTVGHLRPPAPRPTRLVIADGASLAYPAGWKRIRADRGAATVALVGSGGVFLGYLNLTPRQGAETLGDWPHFRAAHNADEGDRAVKSLSARRDVPFLGARGTCLTDSYTTSSRIRYTEMACLVVGHRKAVVVVAASPAGRWRGSAPTLERAIHSLRL